MWDALDGKADGNSHGKTHDFHDVTIVFAGSKVTFKGYIQHEFLCRLLIMCSCLIRAIPGVLLTIHTSMYVVFKNVRSHTQMRAEVHIMNGLVIIGEQMQNVHLSEQMQKV